MVFKIYKHTRSEVKVAVVEVKRDNCVCAL